MKFKITLIAVNCGLTLLNQTLYHYSPASDALRYLQLADQISNFNFFDPAANAYGHFFYSVFLALIGNTFGYHHYVVGLIQSLVLCLTCLFLISELEKYTHKDLTGLTVFLFLVPEIHLFNGYMLTESLAMSLLALAFGLALRIYNRSATYFNLLLLSLIIGITAMHRVECAVCIFPIAYLLFPKIKNRLALHLFMLTSIPVFLLLLNGARNYKIYNVFKLTAFNGGEVIFSGNNENADGSNHGFEKHKYIFIPQNRIEELNKIQGLPLRDLYPARDAFYYSLAKEAWEKDPFKQISVIPDKFAKNWLLPGNFDVYTSDTTKTRGLQLGKIMDKSYFQNAWYAPYKHLFYLLIHWALLSIIIWGIIYIDRQNRFQVSVLIMLLFFVMFSVPFCGLPRWHVPIFPLLIIAFTPNVLVERINRMLAGFLNQKNIPSVAVL